jgi:competence CoiA-like predicted nuclease
LKDKLEECYRVKGDPDIELEVPIDMKWRARGRVIDILVTWPMGWREAHEIQLSAITPQALEERTDDYLRSGIDVIWWIGNRANTKENKDWCMERFGEAYILQDQYLEQLAILSSAPQPSANGNE